jgi:Rrf2 family iron-sulfur cluster assembly transcriptional regulator
MQSAVTQAVPSSSAKAGMDILRRNTDYALRLMVGLARHQENNGSVSTRLLAEEQDVSYQLACKLMQQLHEARLVASCMGPKGGFRLNRRPAEISLLEIIEVVQGPLSLNRCLVKAGACSRSKVCPMRGKISELQGRMGEYLHGITLEELASDRKANGSAGERI